MHLKRLEIQGFKSFARKTVLEFEKGVTSIVGPNGSGKSNIADCLRWVLGEQSSKLMRGKKSDDVIFAGSDKKTKLGFAEVAATFDNSDHKIPLDVSEVSIGRRVDRSGESEYLINGNRVRLLDIVDLVIKSNIGTSRYTVIGQGTIDQMILAGPAEVKNLIDEASGIKTYYIKREKTLRRLEQTAQNLMRAEDLIAEIEPRLKSLRRQAKRMEARESIEAELKGYRRQFYAAQYRDLRTQSEKLGEQIAGQKKAEEHEAETKIKELSSQLSAAEEEAVKNKRELGAKQGSLQELQSKLQAFYRQLEKPKGPARRDFSSEYENLDKDFSALENALSAGGSEEIRAAAQKLLGLWQKLKATLDVGQQEGTDMQEIRLQLVELSAQKDVLAEEINKLSVAESKASQSAQFLRQQLSEARKQGALSIHGELEIEKTRIDTQLEVVCNEIKHYLGNEIMGQIAEAKTEPASDPALSEKIDKLQRQLDLIGGVDELTLQEYKETEERYTSLSTQIEDLKKAVQDLREIIDELDERIKVRFNEAFHRINEKFEHYFRVLFNGGRAYLSVLRAQEVKEEEELGESAEDAPDTAQLRPEEKMLQKYEQGKSNITGVDMKATPPGKKLSSVQALSGGERALTSIAFLCSLLTCFPSPFVVLDEVDAALDEANTIRFGQILGTLAHQTQFITITHNRETMAISNALYGITMGDDGVSKLLAIRLEQAKVYAK